MTEDSESPSDKENENSNEGGGSKIIEELLAWLGIGLEKDGRQNTRGDGGSGENGGQKSVKKPGFRVGEEEMKEETE